MLRLNEILPFQLPPESLVRVGFYSQCHAFVLGRLSDPRVGDPAQGPRGDRIAAEGVRGDLPEQRRECVEGMDRAERGRAKRAAVVRASAESLQPGVVSDRAAGMD